MKEVLTITQAAKFYPSKTHSSTIIRHITKGIKTPAGVVKLEATRLGGRWVTTQEAIDRFRERLTASRKEAGAEYEISDESRARLRRIMSQMKNRCCNKKMRDYRHYGGRGISICGKWLDRFSSFESWAMQNGYSDDLSIERIDNDGNYTPENCKWATRLEQARNRRNNVLVTAFGETKPISAWAQDNRCVVNESILQARISAGVDHHMAVTKPSGWRYKNRKK